MEAKGFKKYSQTDIPLAVQQQATFDVSLQVGDIATTVEVQATAPLLNTTISTLGQVIENKLHDVAAQYWAKHSVPANHDAGRGGLEQPDQPPTNTNFVANGARNSTSDVLVDGAIVNTTEQNTGVTDLKWTPSLDAVQEFKMQVNFYQAEYAQSGGADHEPGDQVRHQRVPRQRVLVPARLRLQRQQLVQQPERSEEDLLPARSTRRRVGGPIRKNKTFFFATFEYTRSKSPQTYTGSAPIPAFRDGDFTRLLFSDGRPMTIYDPFNLYKDSAGVNKRNPYPGNLIPKSAMRPGVAEGHEVHPAAQLGADQRVYERQ